MKVVCHRCAQGYEVPEGSPPGSIACPACKAPGSDHFSHASSIRFETLENPSYVRACEHARRGERDPAFAELEGALAAGMDLELVDNDPALSRLRADPRYVPLLKKYRPR